MSVRQSELTPPEGTPGVPGAPETRIDVDEDPQAKLPVTEMVPEVNPAPKLTLIEFVVLEPVTPEGSVQT